MEGSGDKEQQIRENTFLSIFANILIPTLILVKLSGPDKLGPATALVVALSFPVGYGIYDFVRRRSFNLISFLGIVNVLLTGGIGLLEIGGVWFAVKEAAIPGIIGTAIYVSQRMGRPLLRNLFFNDQLINLDAVNEALAKADATERFEELMVTATYLIALSFAISSVINFVLAKVIVSSAPGTVAFNEQVGYMNAISFPVIMVSSSSLMIYALWRLLTGVRKLTGLEWEQILRQK